MQININTDAVVAYTNKLEKLRKSALPNAIRETLSKAALDVKQRTMPKSVKSSFTQRNKTFFKAFSRVEFAKGMDIRSMQSKVGFTKTGLKGDSSQAIEDLQQQEHGGTIDGRSFIPMDGARSGKNPKRMVAPRNRIGQIDDIVKAHGNITPGKRRVRSKKQRWVRAAIMAKKLHGNNAFVMGNPKNGRVTVRRIDSVSSSVSTKSLQIKSTPVYSFMRGRMVSVKSRGFMKRASLDTSTNMDLIFITEARKQIDRILNR